jgi:tRNA(Ile)-lysidine synthase TilS/MesJ
MRPGDHIAVPLSGDRASSGLCFFLQDLARTRRDIRISAIPTDPGTMAGPDGPTPEEAAAGIGATRFALPAGLDEIAVSVLSGILRGLPALTPVSGGPGKGTGKPIPRIYPFSGIPAEEIILYARLQDVGSDISRPGESRGIFHNEVKTILDGYGSRHPATKYAVANLGHQLARCGLFTDEEIP